jgi:hypothetical protein
MSCHGHGHFDDILIIINEGVCRVGSVRLKKKFILKNSTQL